MPKKVRELTSTEVRRLTHAVSKKKGKAYNALHPVGGVAGLLLQVTPLGGRSWIYRTVVDGKRQNIGLGGFPEISLSDARNKARAIREDIQRGINPKEQRKADRLARLDAQRKKRTFEEVSRECHKIRTAEFKNAKHADQWINTLETYAFPVIGQMPVNEIETGHVVDVLREIWQTKHETATRVRQRIASVMDYASASNLREGSNPAAPARIKDLLPKSKAVKKKAGGKKHHPRVPIDDMPRFMADLRPRSAISAKALEFAILTAARSGEVRGATWSEIDLGARLWSLSAERMKADRPHKVPLSDAAVRLLEGLPRGADDDLLFPAPRGGQLSDMTLNKMLKDMHAAKVKAGEPGYSDPDQAGRVATPHGTARSSFKDWSRRSTSRKLSEGHFSPFPDEWGELALAHVNSDETRAAYARDELLAERMELMQAWADFCGGDV